MTANISFIQDRQMLSSSTTPLSESKELGNVLQRIVQNAGALLDVHNCSVALLNVSTSMLVTLAALQDNGQKTRQTQFRVSEGVAGWVAEHGEPLVISDVSLDPRFKRLGRTPVGSMLCVPLIDHGRFIGTITASSQDTQTFDTQKVKMLSIFAEQAVLAITNARHAELAQHHADQLELLMRLSRTMTTRLEPEMLYRTILANVRRLLPCERATIFLYRSDSQELSAVAEWSVDEYAALESERDITIFEDRPGSKRERISLYDTHSVTAWAAVHMHPMLNVALPRHPQEIAGTSNLCELATPFVSKDVLYGVLSLKRQEPFTSDELRLARNLGYMVAGSLENVELFHKVSSDQEQLRAILSSSSDGIALLGGGNCFVEANSSFERIFALESAESIGMEYMELLTNDEEGGPSAEDLQKMQQALDQRKALPYIELELSIQGSSRAIGLSFTPVSTTNDPLFLVIARDVTAIRDATRLKANFLSMITHELRSPLNAINGYLDLTLNGIAGEITEQQREFLQRARSGSEHLFALVEDLLLVSRADSGQLTMNRQVISLREVVENAVEELDLTAIDGGISLEVDLPQGFPRIYADAGRIQQVLRNLLSNAFHFTPAGGQVTVSAHISDEPIPGREIALDENVHVVKLQVHDTGSGIAPEFLERIFERFYQVPSSRSGRSGGQGLGLAIVKMIVELHGGTIRVESEPGSGSTFTCLLPCLLS
jgi:PAS domain S-box-containing protein